MPFVCLRQSVKVTFKSFKNHFFLHHGQPPANLPLTFEPLPSSPSWVCFAAGKTWRTRYRSLRVMFLTSQCVNKCIVGIGACLVILLGGGWHYVITWPPPPTLVTPGRDVLYHWGWGLWKDAWVDKPGQNSDKTSPCATPPALGHESDFPSTGFSFLLSLYLSGVGLTFSHCLCGRCRTPQTVSLF